MGSYLNGEAGHTVSYAGIATIGAQTANLIKFTSTSCTTLFIQDVITACDTYTWIDGLG